MKVGVLALQGAFREHRETLEALGVEAHELRSPAGLAGAPFPGVFIRAPVLERTGPDVEVLAGHDGHPVLVRRGPVWGSTFHPELAGDLRVHERFLHQADRE